VFRRFSGLTELDISDSATLTGYGLWRLATVGLRSLTTLDLSGSYKEHRSQLDNGFEALSLGGFPALRSLKLAGCEVTDSVVKQISTISTLTELNIRQCVPLVLGLGPMSMRSRAPCPTWSIVLSSPSSGQRACQQAPLSLPYVLWDATSCRKAAPLTEPIVDSWSCGHSQDAGRGNRRCA
jgi:hypothetical protein